ncbi:unnamed protein product [Vitrella brassicaformis CCMP3155]|uniref:FAD-binding domain-containing protein n=2 Tax=Vitrella brassicaformis TaxID=1169539 RepID=A0A0G4EJJ1_VITBC|nr:unnamed protein product [Vitrella brassicaformis CCMP3155]|eukprot:CEL97243.1 unnamed protein product [Vitrella brassicaformis CCMP3155]
MSSFPSSVEVLVVGAGPTGLTLANCLQRHGVDYLTVDLNEKAVDTSRALAVQWRTQEIFRDLGLIDEARAAGRHIQGIRVVINGKETLKGTLPEVSAHYGRPLVLCQSETERLLIENLTRLGGGDRIRRPVEVLSLTPTDEGVTVTLRDLQAGPEAPTHTMTTRYVVGCDGARSFVRKSLDIPFEGKTIPGEFVVADCLLRWEVPSHDDCTRFKAICAGGGVLFCVPMFAKAEEAEAEVEEVTAPEQVTETPPAPPAPAPEAKDEEEKAEEPQAETTEGAKEGAEEQKGEAVPEAETKEGTPEGEKAEGAAEEEKKEGEAVAKTEEEKEEVKPHLWRIITTVPVGKEGPSKTSPSKEEVEEIIKKRVPSAELVDMPWSARYSINKRAAHLYYKDKRIFLAGDAAHVHPPLFGQGMNTGIQDAYNLGWKLAFVLKGGAPTQLLDTYEAERFPIDCQTVRRTSRGFPGIFKGGIASRFLLGTVVPIVWTRPALTDRLAGFISQTQQAYPADKGVIGPAAVHHAIVPGSRVPNASLDVLDLQEVEGKTEAVKTRDTPVSVHELLSGPHHTLMLLVAMESAPEHAAPKSWTNWIPGCGEPRRTTEEGWLPDVSQKLSSLACEMTCKLGKAGETFSGVRVVVVVRGAADTLGNACEAIKNAIEKCCTEGSGCVAPEVLYCDDSSHDLLDLYKIHMWPGKKAGGAFLMIRPDGVLSHIGYASDSYATKKLRDYVEKYLIPKKEEPPKPQEETKEETAPEQPPAAAAEQPTAEDVKEVVTEEVKKEEALGETEEEKEEGEGEGEAVTAAPAEGETEQKEEATPEEGKKEGKGEEK